jgi:hypothetical protein
MPQILTQDHFSEYLRDGLVQALADNRLHLRIDHAEMRVVSRYREEAALADSSMYFDDPLGAETSPGIVQLRGWAETDDGTPDVDAMPDELVKRLRMVIAAVVEWRYDQEDTERIESESKGSVSVSYRDSPSVPTRLFTPLDKYDERHPFSGRW